MGLSARRSTFGPATTLRRARTSLLCEPRQARRLLAALGPIPAWAKDAAIGHRLINARSETAAAMGNTHWGVVSKNDIPGVVCEPPHL